MKKFENHQQPRRKYRFDIVVHKKALIIWWDSIFKFWKLRCWGGVVLALIQLGTRVKLNHKVTCISDQYGDAPKKETEV
jgi:hypothetical protein